MSIAAKRGQALGKESDGIPTNVDSGVFNKRVEVVGPFLVSDSGGTESDHFDIFKGSGSFDINVAEAGKTSS